MDTAKLKREEGNKLEKIIVKAEKLYKYVEELKINKSIEAVEISIFNYENDQGITKKYFTIDIVECGGLGLISNDESIEEMSKDEILDIQ